MKAVLCVLLACSSVSAAGNALDRLAEAAKQEGPFERLLVSANDLGEVAGNRHRMQEAYVLGWRMAGG